MPISGYNERSLCVCVYGCPCVCVCLCVCVSVCVYVYMCGHICLHICIYVCVHKLVCLYTLILCLVVSLSSNTRSRGEPNILSTDLRSWIPEYRNCNLRSITVSSLFKSKQCPPLDLMYISSHLTCLCASGIHHLLDFTSLIFYYHYVPAAVRKLH